MIGQKNVTFRTKTIFELNRRIQEKNVLTNKCHEDWAKNLSSRLFTCGHVFSLITTIFKLNQDIHKTKILTKFHDDCTKNVNFRVFTSNFYYINIRKKPPPGGHVFFTDPNHFRTRPSYPGNKCSDQFHKDWANNVSSRLFTCFHCIHIEKTTPPLGDHVFPL
ncbi:hypothetical protein DPMN_085777 [Dreissena polymorpha]|uniref:Uncharacterized protein n=1 Tax=Dreissena polymorpha TaxID=45954 RepID=A0A9D4BM85_DREPO|nr:hypothetical protein DPMN_085777 [Dreissena polymorpha]